MIEGWTEAAPLCIIKQQHILWEEEDGCYWAAQVLTVLRTWQAFNKCCSCTNYSENLIFRYFQLCDFFFFLNKFIYLYFWMHWVFVAARGLSLVSASRGYSSMQCASFSLRWLLLLRSTGSRRLGFSSCGVRAQLLRGTWDLPRRGLEPVSPALAGRFLTTAPPGRPYVFS